MGTQSRSVQRIKSISLPKLCRCTVFLSNKMLYSLESPKVANTTCLALLKSLISSLTNCSSRKSLLT